MLEALAPVALLIALGTALRVSGFLPEPAWPPIERLVYYVLFPALLVSELAAADLGGLPVGAMGASLLLTQLLMFVPALAIRRLWRLDGPAYTSVLQCLGRWNSYVALALTPGLFGREAMAHIAVAVAVMIPTANVMSVAVLARHGHGAQAGLATFARSLAANPLILACVVGIGINLADLALPGLLREPLAMLGRTTAALGLLAVGAGLQPAAVRGRPLLIAATTAVHLLLKPALAMALALLLGLHGTSLGIVVLACAVPTATSAYILARLMGGDAALMAALITATTAAALLTLPLVAALVHISG